MEAWIKVQKATFARWINMQVPEQHFTDWENGFSDGLVLITLLEKLSGKSISHYNKRPKMRIQKLENISLALRFMTSEGIKLVGIGPEDLCDGHIKLELGVIWTIILRYQFPESQGAKFELLAWVSDQVKDLVPKERVPTNFSSDWTDGLLLSALVRKSLPEWTPETHKKFDHGFHQATRVILMMAATDPQTKEPRHPECDWWKLPQEIIFIILKYLALTPGLQGDPLGDTKKSIKLAEELLHIPPLMDAEDIVFSPEEHSLITYLSLFYKRS